MGRTTISWGDGSGDNIYLDYNALEGTQTVTVSSDANSGSSSRTKTITFSTTGATPVTQTLTVIQEAGSTGDLIIITRSDVAISHNETALGYKPYDAEVEYLKSNSQAYIDTGISGSRSVTIKVQYKYSTRVNYGAIYGNYTADSAKGYRAILGTSSNQIIVAIRSSFSATGKGSANTINVKHTLVANTNGSYTIDGTTVGSVTPSSGVSGNIALFNRSLTTPVTNRNIGLEVYSFIVEESDSTVMDLIPVRVGTIGYMFDKVTGLLFGNVGTGAFEVGPDKEE